MEDLKSYRKKEVPLLILGDVLILLYILQVFDISIINTENAEWINLVLTILNSTTLSSVLYIFTVVLEGVFSDKQKYNLVYLFVGKMPGETIFSDIESNNKDIRFSYDDLRECHPEIYNNMPKDMQQRCKYENKEWYKLLSKHKNNGMVFQSHRDSLMFRDMYCSNILMLILYLILSVGLKTIPFSVQYVVFLLMLTILLNIAARNKTKRFAYNVIACELSKKGGIDNEVRIRFYWGK